MKIKFLTGLVLAMLAAVSLQQASAQPITLTGTSYTNTFDTIEANQGPPNEWFTYTGATVTAPGIIYTWSSANYLATGNSWRFTTGRFANQAGTYSYGSAYSGATNFLGGEGTQIQTNELNRCLAVRQTGTLGDPGAAFVLKIADTVNRQNFVMTVDLLNLDPTSPRTTTWTVDYGFGATPSSFVPVATWVNTVSNFTTYHTNITFANGTIDNNAGPVWIRIVALSASAGGGSRETTAIDNFGLTWAAGAACTHASVTANPAPVAGYINGNASFTVGAVGTAPLYYVWLKNGTTVLSDDGHFGGTATPALSITTLLTTDAGTYSCLVSNVCGGTIYSQTSSGAALTVSAPPTENIAYLRTLVDPTSWAPTNMSLLYTVTGTITTYTNLTTANTASYYLQDGTGGINLFCTFGSTFRPTMGDLVTATGFLSSYADNLELDADLSNPAMGVTDMGPGAGLPTPQLVAWDNLYQYGTNAFLNYNVQGSLVVLTNVYFGTNAGLVTTNGNYALTVTNSQGKIGHIELYAGQDNDLTNRTMPAFAYAIMGPLVAYTTGYEVAPTRWSDVVTTAPAVTLATPANGASFTAPANITLTATVTANGYTVNAVNYYNGATFIGSASTAPYTYAWNGVGAGTNALSAQVVYSMYGINTFTVSSGINTVTVNAPLAPVSSVSIAPGAGNSLNISYAGGSASQFVLVGTNNITAPLATWPVIQTTNGTTPAVFNVPIGSGQMFYKIKSQ